MVLSLVVGLFLRVLYWYLISNGLTNDSLHTLSSTFTVLLPTISILTLVCTTNFLPGAADTTTAPPPDPSTPSLPPSIINIYTSVLDLLHRFVPPTIHNTFNLAYTAITHTLTPSILTSLLYRISVLYAATRIIPAVRGVSQPNSNTTEPVIPSKRWQT